MPSTARRAASSATSAGWMGTGDFACPPPAASSSRCDPPAVCAMPQNLSIMWPKSEALMWPHRPIPSVATALTCEYGHVDQVGQAVKSLKAAQQGVLRTQARAQQMVADARAKVDQARAALAEAVVAEYTAGARVSDLAIRAEVSRETIRRILRAAGVEAE